jgi:acetyl-CoA carboxylase alpha subunit
MSDALKTALLRHLGELESLGEDTLLEQRYERLRRQGVYRAAS